MGESGRLSPAAIAMSRASRFSCAAEFRAFLATTSLLVRVIVRRTSARSTLNYNSLA